MRQTWKDLLKEISISVYSILANGCWKYDLRVCDDDKLVHILYSWTLSIVLSSSKMLTKYVSEIGFYLRPQVKPTQLGPIDRASPYLRTPVSDPKL
jgi:hypothetical protein